MTIRQRRTTEPKVVENVVKVECDGPIRDDEIDRKGLRRESGLTDYQLNVLEHKQILVSHRRNEWGQRLYKRAHAAEAVEQAKTFIPRQARMSPGIQYTQSQAKIVFNLLNKGKSIQEIASDPDVAIHPEALHAIAAKYSELGACVTLSPSFLKELNAKLSRFYPELQTEEDVKILLLSLPRRLACSDCQSRSKGLCRQCHLKAERAEAKRVQRSATSEPSEVDMESSAPLPVNPFSKLPPEVQDRFASENDLHWDHAVRGVHVEPMPGFTGARAPRIEVAEKRAKRHAAKVRLNNHTNVPVYHDHSGTKTGTEE